MRKIRLILLTILIIFPMLAITQSAEAGAKNCHELIGTYIKETRNLRSSREFANKRVLLVVGAQKKATTVEGLLAAVNIALSDPQHSIFVEPLLIAQMQEAGFADVEVSGAFIKNINLSQHPPAEHVGLAALVLQYTGDSTLPIQALANIRTQ